MAVTRHGRTPDLNFRRIEALLCSERGNVRSCRTGLAITAAHHHFAALSNGGEDGARAWWDRCLVREQIQFIVFADRRRLATFKDMLAVRIFANIRFFSAGVG